MVALAHWLAAAAAALGACSRVEEPPGARPAFGASELAASAARSPGAAGGAPNAVAPGPLLTPTQLLTLPSSAYQAAIFADDEAIELLTGTAAYRLVPGKEPARRALDLGFAATVTRRSYVYWSKGALWSAARRAPAAAAPKKLAELPEQPQRIVSDIRAEELAWLAHSAEDGYRIERLLNRRVQALYRSPGSIDAVTMVGDAVFFVERPGAEGWRIGRASLAGGDPAFTANKTGRWPAMLGGEQDVVYYDAARREVLALSRDLQRERSLARDVICSPLAAAARVYCSSMDGIFELTATGQPRQVLRASRQLVTSLAANSARLAFIADVGGRGQDQLVVNVVVPSEAPAAAGH